MRGIPLPDREEDFTADPSELFFDLVYVFAFSRLVSRLILDPDWDGVGRAALLFAMMWVPWSTFTWSANAVAGNSRPVRLLFMVATVAAVGMAGSVDTAFGDGAPIFAVSVSIILIMALFTMLAGTANEPTVRASIVRYSIPNMVAVAAMVIGALLDGDAQIVAWIGGVACVAVGMARAGSSEWVVRPGHFAERHGLLVIVALGEVIVAIGAPVVDGLGSGHGLPGRTVAALLGAGVFAGLLWWSYYRQCEPVKREQCTGDERSEQYVQLPDRVTDE
jgi:low temperature requirement protein LtrA